MTSVIVVEVFVPNSFRSATSRAASRHSLLLAVSRPWQVVRAHVGRAEVP